MNRQPGWFCRYTAELHLSAPLASGTGGVAEHTDRPARRDRQGDFELPATAVAGVLRGLLERTAHALGEPDLVAALCGEAHRETGRPSLLRVSVEPRCRRRDGEVRDGVGLHRTRGAARARIKYDLEVSPPGLAFDLTLELRGLPTELEHDDPARLDRAERAMALLVEALDVLPLAFGGRVATGLGAASLRHPTTVEGDLARPAMLRSHLLRLPDPPVAAWTPPDLSACHVVAGYPERLLPQQITATIQLRVDPDHGPLLLRGRDGLDLADAERQRLHAERDRVDARYRFRRRADGTLEPLLCGASLRGAIRSHAERILRTIALTAKAPAGLAVAADPLQKTRTDGQPELVSSAFGLADEVRRRHEDLRRQQLPDDQIAEQIEALVWERSDLGARLFGSSQLGSRVRVGEAVAAAGWVDRLRDHVAIDRYTAGAADQRLFNALALEQATFTTRLTCLSPEPWMIGLLLLVLKDLHDGRLSLGSGTSRGYGAITGCVTRLEVAALRGSQLAAALNLAPQPGRVWAQAEVGGDPTGPFLAGLPANWVTAGEGMVEQLWESVRGFEPHALEAGR